MPELHGLSHKLIVESKILMNAKVEHACKVGCK